jgi:hypothetical protein
MRLGPVVELEVIRPHWEGALQEEGKIGPKPTVDIGRLSFVLLLSNNCLGRKSRKLVDRTPVPFCGVLIPAGRLV